METVHTVLIWLAVRLGASVVLSPRLGMWIKNTNYSLASRKLNRVRGNGRA